MTKISVKTKILNGFRNTAKLSFLEKYLVQKTQGKSANNFFTKIIPNNYQYSPETIRRCRRDEIEYEIDISDYMQYCIYYGIQTEPRTALYNLVKDGTTVIDVGTNFGETLLNFAKLNPGGMNIGFEPVPFLYEKAKNNISLNNFENIVLENLALSDDFGELTFNLENKNNSGGIYLSKKPAENKTTQIIKAEPLDSYVNRHKIKEISLIKIDVEGFEMNVINGAKNTIATQRPTIFMEVNDAFLRRQNSTAKELINNFLSKNYKVIYADNNNPVSLNDSFEEKHFDIICLP